MYEHVGARVRAQTLQWDVCIIAQCAGIRAFFYFVAPGGWDKQCVVDAIEGLLGRRRGRICFLLFSRSRCCLSYIHRA